MRESDWDVIFVYTDERTSIFMRRPRLKGKIPEKALSEFFPAPQAISGPESGKFSQVRMEVLLVKAGKEIRVGEVHSNRREIRGGLRHVMPE
jgi:hypothetical protein